MGQARVLAVANQKGGVGKTTTALTLGAALARMNQKVLVLDLDPHVCASVHMGLFPEKQIVTLYHLLQALPEHQEGLFAKLEQCPRGQNWYMIAGDTRLAEVESDWRDRRGKGFVLKSLLENPASRYDFIILDCPPQMGVLLANALVAADLVIIPVQTEFLGLHGMKLLFDTMRLLNPALPAPVAYRALATMYDKRANACTRVLELLRRKLANALLETVIPVDTRVREAGALGQVVFDSAPTCRAAKAYEQLAREVMSL